MTKQINLNGCPFCGEGAFWTRGDKRVKQPDTVMCLECGATIEGTYSPMSALDKWNFRVNDYEILKSRRSVNIDGS